MTTYDRYSQFRVEDTIKIVPFGEIPEQDSDYTEIYEKNISRLDKISQQYYNDPNYGWLILQANPEVGSMEYEIPDQTVLRIPYPLEQAISGYRESIENYY